MTTVARLIPGGFVLLATLFFAGCGSNAPLIQGTPPTVIGNAVQVDGVAPNRRQEVQFSQAMNASTINAQSLRVTDASGDTMPGTVTYDSNFDIASFQPTPALQAGATYNVTLSTAVTSASGVPLAQPYTYSFTTRSTTDDSPISVLKVSPMANATCVNPDSMITVTFDEAPDASTVTTNDFTVMGPNGAIPVKLSINISTTQVVLTPVTSLPSGTITVTVSNVGDLADMMMKAPYTWSFSTACNGSGGGTGGGNSTTQYESPLLLQGGQTVTVNGQITVDQSGMTSIQLSGAPSNTSYTVQFCPVVLLNVSPAPTCFNLTTISTGSSGAATTTIKFPRSGEWAGDFNLNTSTGKTAYSTYLLYGLSNQTYFSTLLPQSSLGASTTTQNSATNGTVKYSNGTVVFSLMGGPPNTLYSTSESETYYLDGSGTYQLSTFTTNAAGSGTSSSPLNNPGGDIFQEDSNSGPEYIGGFTVPN